MTQQLAESGNVTGSLAPKPKRAPASHLVESLSGPRWYDPWKAGAELVAALLMLLLASPLILMAALLVKITSRGPAFYSQTRLGRDRRHYTIYKLRSMRHNCEKLSGPCWSTRGDARVTWVGSFLRRTHIDELPQLWNVLRGDMSLVGPRPERPEFLPRLEEAVPLYSSRLLVKPGVTGLAQVQLPADTDLESVRHKIAYDLYYVQHCNPWLDFRLVLATALHMLCISHELVARVLFLPRGEPVEAAYKELVAQSRRLASSTPEVTLSPDDVVSVEAVPCV